MLTLFGINAFSFQIVSSDLKNTVGILVVDKVYLVIQIPYRFKWNWYSFLIKLTWNNPCLKFKKSYKSISEIYNQNLYTNGDV